MQKKVKLTLGAGALAALLAAGAGIAFADGQHDGKGGDSHGGRMGRMEMMGGHDGMGGGMDGMMMGGMGQIDFTAADANKDGKLTADEITAWRAAQVKAIDSNADGKLSADEITAFVTAQLQTKIAEHAKDMVSKLDTDGDGLLSAAELLARPLATPDFQRLDRNGDGAVTQDELAPPMGGQGGQGNDAPPPAAPAPSGN